MDALLAELFRAPAHPPVRPDGPTARNLRDLWLGGMPLPRAATAAGLTTKVKPTRRPARDDSQYSAPEQLAPGATCFGATCFGATCSETVAA